MTAADLIGKAVQYCPDGPGRPAWGGIAEYVTDDGWVGIRGPHGRLDEAPLELVEIDPT